MYFDIADSLYIRKTALGPPASVSSVSHTRHRPWMLAGQKIGLVRVIAKHLPEKFPEKRSAALMLPQQQGQWMMSSGLSYGNRLAAPGERRARRRRQAAWSCTRGIRSIPKTRQRPHCAAA